MQQPQDTDRDANADADRAAAHLTCQTHFRRNVFNTAQDRLVRGTMAGHGEMNDKHGEGEGELAAGRGICTANALRD